MLCDVTKVHTGFGMMPRVTHCTEDETWGQVGGSRKVFMARALSFKGGKRRLTACWNGLRTNIGK
ncbi:MAG: hypothetical protein H6574_12225 [Lewinellaceae bacterium]|nr:hypothetical protein [Lewinellaceae bacterium]